MTTELSSRERVLRLFGKEEIDRIPVFSGMGNVTIHGLEKYGWKFSDIHTDARKMASMAASTFQLLGFECAVVPFDLGIEAEALGAVVNFYSHRDDVVYPTIAEKIGDKVKDLNLKIPADLARAGRIPLVTEAIRYLNKELGRQVAIGAWVLGPYTLAGQLVDLADLNKMSFKDTETIGKILDTLAGVLIEISQIYRAAGADYITVREMGAGMDILSQRMFKMLIKPPLEHIFSAIASPNILHICGDTDDIVELMASCGADAISVEQRNHVAKSREKLGPDKLIFGNIDPYGVMVEGKPEDIDNAVKEAITSGVNAIWPGCDIWPTVPRENMEALVRAVKRYGKLG
ncbi:MAG: uroporphyrinogen decarboxylase family protein [Dehalococcoidales bacterium]|jgi:[methyl-Co(III) methanol-specific corrinoid protein]:coenzyme M methyltransferase|nr:uroporphyrinogen decarboxylase family protein [Dehalococcoidales bacterium]|tara:strand:- start:655 stop:1692 length:1038 start_codon:yes stop_codon:yes gene_type:complete